MNMQYLVDVHVPVLIVYCLCRSWGHLGEECRRRQIKLVDRNAKLPRYGPVDLVLHLSVTRCHVTVIIESLVLLLIYLINM